jgi:hypothetical protein
LGENFFFLGWPTVWKQFATILHQLRHSSLFYWKDKESHGRWRSLKIKLLRPIVLAR